MPTPRKITDHRLNGLNEFIDIAAVDDPSAAGASNVYEIHLSGLPSGSRVPAIIRVEFQNGAIGGPADINGPSMEAYLAILIDRLKGFQGMNSTQTGVAAPFACRENACALTHLEEALQWLRKRTLDRIARGVEGKLLK
jgi:hypothetical protein